MNGIDWTHSLAVAARGNDALADSGLGLQETLWEIGMGGIDPILYMAQQRALRALAVHKGYPIVLGAPVTVADEDQDLYDTLVVSYMDGMAIGWSAHKHCVTP